MPLRLMYVVTLRIRLIFLRKVNCMKLMISILMLGTCILCSFTAFAQEPIRPPSKVVERAVMPEISSEQRETNN